MGRRFEVQHDPLTLPAARHPHGALIPDVAEVIPYGRISSDVVEARRHRHLARVGQRTGVPAIGLTLPIGVEGELPETVQILTLAGGAVLGTKHLNS